VRVCHRLGCIGSDTEENHVAEARWQQGLELLFPGLVLRIAAAAGDEHAPEPPPEVLCYYISPINLNAALRQLYSIATVAIRMIAD
jgi:hypothetical protein